MSIRRAFLLLASMVAAVILIEVLIKLGKIDLRVVLRQLQSVSVIAFLKLTLLNCVLVYVSTEKWRRIDAALRCSSDTIPSWVTSFAMTSAGMALGLVVPTQLGMATARTMGTYVHGRPFKRGTAATLFEQSFDLLVVLFLLIASVATWLFKGGALMWGLSAIAMTAVAVLVVSPSINVLRWISASGREASVLARWGIIGRVQELLQSRLMSGTLMRTLVMLSALRFGIVVLMAKQTALAIGAYIPLWQVAVAVPFVVISTMIGVTPGAVGLNELTYTTVLNHFGTALSVAAPWSIANRILATASCVVVAMGALLVRGLAHTTVSSSHNADNTTVAERS